MLHVLRSLNPHGKTITIQKDSPHLHPIGLRILSILKPGDYVWKESGEGFHSCCINGIEAADDATAFHISYSYSLGSSSSGTRRTTIRKGENCGLFYIDPLLVFQFFEEGSSHDLW